MTARDMSAAREAVQQRIADIDVELAAVAELKAERERLAEALNLLGEQPARGKAGSRSGVTRSRRPRRPSPAATKSKTTNRDKVLRFLEGHPGAQAGDIVAHLEVSRGVGYNLLGRLVEQGVLVRESAEGARSQYRLVATSDSRG